MNSRLRNVIGLSGAEAGVSVVLADATLRPTAATRVESDAARHLHIRHVYGNRIEEDLDFSWDEAARSLRCQRRCRNISGAPLELVELGVHLRNVTLPGRREEDYFYHTENPRIYGCFAIPVRLKRATLTAMETEFDTMGGSKWADPGTVTDRIGASVYQPFPAVLVSNHQTREGWVHGSLSQDVFFHNYLIEHDAETLRWDIFSSCKAIRARHWTPGETLYDAWYLGVTSHADDLCRQFDHYAAELRKVLPANQSASTTNRHDVLWGSWNDGVWREIDEERLLKMAEFLNAHLPTVRWMQIDDGYATRARTAGFAHGLGVPYEADGVDASKFPNGLRHVSDGIRERGLRPAIWIGGLIPNNTPLGQEHPEWMSDYSYRLTVCKPLDISIPAARDYMLAALRRFTDDWGFEAIKLDFWSYVFEDSHPLLTTGDKTGYEWRRWWLHELRERFPRDGFLQSGCDTLQGNPFLGEWFNNYRYGIDIGAGNWDHIKPTMQWGAACFATHTGDLFIPNSDAIGILSKLSDADALTAINYCLISRSLVEIAGWLYQNPDHPRLPWIRKAICCPNNGQDVFFADFDYRDPKTTVPPVWFIKTAHFSRHTGATALPARTVACFNTHDAETEFSLRAESLDLPPADYLVTDVWSLSTRPLAELGRFSLPAHQSRLFAISPANGGRQQVLDADIAIAAATETGATLDLTFEHRGNLTLVLSRRPANITGLDGQAMDTTITAGDGNFILRTRLRSPGSRLTLRGA